mgnify:CR=1 FL=1
MVLVMAKTVAECEANPEMHASDFEHLGRLLRETSRTFALSIEGLPEALREELTVSYLLFRVSDYLEDHSSIDAPTKTSLLRHWERVLASDDSLDSFVRALNTIPHRSDDPEAVVAYESGRLLAHTAAFPKASRDAIIRRVRETTLGMAEWQEKGPRVESEKELDEYMHYVAGIVGYLVTDLFAGQSDRISRRKADLMPLAREFGLALQTVNVIRGVRKDYERGWIFVPHSFCRAHGISQDELFDPGNERSGVEVINDLVAKAETHLVGALAYVRSLPRRMHRLRLACAWPLLFAARTLSASRNNAAVLTGEVKVGRHEIKAIMKRSAILGWSNAWLGHYTEKLLRRTPLVPRGARDRPAAGSHATTGK